MKIKNENQDTLRVTLIHAALAFEFETNWRDVLRRATHTRPVGRERRFLINTIKLEDEAFGRVVGIMANEYKGAW